MRLVTMCHTVGDCVKITFSSGFRNPVKRLILIRFDPHASAGRIRNSQITLVNSSGSFVETHMKPITLGENEKTNGFPSTFVIQDLNSHFPMDVFFVEFRPARG